MAYTYAILAREAAGEHDAMVERLPRGNLRYTLRVYNMVTQRRILHREDSSLDGLFFLLNEARISLQTDHFWMAVNALNKAGSAAASAACQLRASARG